MVIEVEVREKQELVDGVFITITPEKVGTDKQVMIFNVTIEKEKQPGCEEGSLWEESFSTREHLSAFLKGLQVAVNMTAGQYMPIPVIPRE